jgi:O-antigen ligase
MPLPGRRPAAFSAPPYLPSTNAAPPVSSSPLEGLASRIMGLCIFAIVSRLPEVMANVIGTSLHMALLLMGASLFIVLLSGRVFDIFEVGVGRYISLFTLWFLFCIPFSIWRGGSFLTFRDNWLPTLAIFFVVALIPLNRQHLKIVFGAQAWAVLLVLVFQFKYGTMAGDRGSMSVSETLSNPNIMALQLLFGAPFLLFWTESKSLFSPRALLGVSGLLLLASVILLRTGSRSGLIGLVIIVFAIVISRSFMHALALSGALLIGTLVTIPFIPKSMLDRYGTLLTSGEESRDASAENRLQHIQDSLYLTLYHPIFGIGPGQFRVASNDLAIAEKRPSLWLETHNTFTQLSSETGLVGLAFFVAMIVSSLKPLWRDYKNPGKDKERRYMARAILLSALGLFITTNFCSTAYLYYWPVLCGTAMAYIRVMSAEDRLSRANAAQQQPPPTMTAPRPQPRRVPSWTPGVMQPRRVNS